MDKSMKDLIAKNCRREAEAFVLRGRPLPNREGKWEEFRQNVINELIAIHGAPVPDPNSPEGKARKIVDILNTKFGDEWMEWAKSLYKDTGTTIVSLARDWNEEKSWPYENEYEKMKIVYRLINYKVYDRKRGRGSIEADLKDI